MCVFLFYMSTFYYLCTVDDVLSQASCAVGPNLPFLRPNNRLGLPVELHCQCMYDNGTMITGTRWFRGSNLVEARDSQNPTRNPYYITGVPSRLIIAPRYSSTYDGTYTCSPDSTFPTGSSVDTITLIAGSEYVAIYCLFIM